jgi:hypothetical protein
MAALFEGVEAAVRAIDGISVAMEAAARAAVAEAAHLIERGAKQRAPARTGTLRRSITVFGPNRLGLGVYEAYVGPTAVYGRRIELGFVGSDRLGRNFDQSGQPYLKPAFDEAIAGPVQAIFAARMGAAASGGK